MNQDQAGQKVRSAFDVEYQPPSTGFDSRMRAAIQQNPVRASHPRWAFGVAAAFLALVAVLVISLGRMLPLSNQSGTAQSTPTPTVVKPILAAPTTLQMAGTGVGWLFAGQLVYRSTDQGAHWADVSPHAISGRPQVAFALDGNHAWVTRSSSLQGQPTNDVTFYGTSDGGTSWQRLGSAPIKASWLHQMTFVDDSHGWLLVSLGAASGSEAVGIWGTTDGGHSWTELATSAAPQHPPATGQLSAGCDKTGMAFRDAMTGWLTGSCAGGSPFLYRTVDGGHVWQAKTLPMAQGQTVGTLGYSPTVMPPIFLDRSFGLLPVYLALSRPDVQSLVVYVTRDGGDSWTPTSPVPSARLVAALNSRRWIAVVPPRQIGETQDGYRYSYVSSDTDLSHIDQFSFADKQHGLALIQRTNGSYELLRTADGGIHWVLVA